MYDYQISVGDDRSCFVLERCRKALDEIEQTVTARRDMSAVLNVVGRPIALGRCIIPLVEQCVESFEDECSIFRFNCLTHFSFHTFLPKMFSALIKITEPFCRRQRGRTRR